MSNDSNKRSRKASDASLEDCRNQAIEQGHEHDDIHGEHNEWKFRAPYKIHSNSTSNSSGTEDGDESTTPGTSPETSTKSTFKALYEASCHCGRVQYQLSREKPLAAKICHCRTCQVLHGSMFQWAAIFEKTDINFIRGHHDLGWYESSEKTTRHKLPCKVSCAYCRTPIMDEGRKMILLFPGAIKFRNGEERKLFAPQCHIFYGERAIDIPDGKPKWAGLNDKSELLDE